MRKNVDKIMKWLWPEVCPFCENVCRMGICAKCRRELEKLRVIEPRCMQCGKPVRHMEQEYCHDFMHTHHYYDRGMSLWLHKHPVSTSIYQFKYHNQRRYGIHFAEELVRIYGRTVIRWNPDVIIPIPLHPKRRRKRGYNQAEIVAEKIGAELGIRVDSSILIRKVNTDPQKKLNHTERKENLKQAFAIRRPLEKGMVILVVDDIYTTGNTIDAAAKVLKDGGAEKVYFLTISIGQGY